MSDMNDRKDDFKEKASDLYDKGKAKATNTYQGARDRVNSMAEEVSETASNIYQGSKQKIGDIQDSLGEHSDEVIKLIKEKPVLSVLIAGGIGFLISTLLKK